jgi:hypothetical protein
MSPPTKKQLNKGFYGFTSDDAEFLKVDSSPWKASASGVGYNSKFKDDYGYRAGQGAYSDELDDGLKLQNRLPDERRNSVSNKLADLPYDAEGMGSGSALLGGAGPLPQKYGVGKGRPRYAPKSGPQSNADDQ